MPLIYHLCTDPHWKTLCRSLFIEYEILIAPQMKTRSYPKHEYLFSVLVQVSNKQQSKNIKAVIKLL